MRLEVSEIRYSQSVIIGGRGGRGRREYMLYFRTDPEPGCKGRGMPCTTKSWMVRRTCCVGRGKGMEW